jgi:quinohemoprotein ethanol dehydrogenase
LKTPARTGGWLLALASVLLCTEAFAAAAPKPVANVDDARLSRAAKEPQNWLTHGGNWEEQRFSTLDSINVATVTRLKPAWSFDFDTTRGQEATPIVADGVMYVSTAWSKVYALDAKTGKELWFFDPKVPGPAGVPTCCDVVNRGVAVYDGKVFVGTIDARLIALDAATGRVVWSVATAPAGSVYTITGAPRVARGKVFIGNAGADFGGRGFVSAYEAATGKQVWRFFLVPGDPAGKPDGVASDDVLAKLARPTWFGDWYKYGGGGHVWNALVFDPDFNQLYLATGNGLPWNRQYRSAGKGDNLFIASIVALDADTGRYKWHYQEVPGDEWDYDVISDMTLVDLELQGRKRKVLLHAPKAGFFYVLDRQSGEVISAEPFVPLNWATHVDLKTGRPAIVEAARDPKTPWRGMPGGGGGHSWHPQAFSPQTGLVYIPAMENSTLYLPTPEFKYVDGVPNIGIDLAASVHGAAVASSKPAPPPAAYLLAWNPVTQKAQWRVSARGGGVLATAGNLVIQGRSRDGVLGELVAHRADTGEKLWSYPTPNAIAGGPITYAVGGEQFVAASSGASSIALGGQTRMRHVGRLVAFKLDGGATFPPEAPLAPPPNPPATVASKADFTAGEKHYGDYCARCHGFDANSGNVIPDLRRSAMLTDKASWEQVVIGGALAERGMVSWAKFLTPAQGETIRAYVGEQARTLQQRSQK